MTKLIKHKVVYVPTDENKGLIVGLKNGYIHIGEPKKNVYVLTESEMLALLEKAVDAKENTGTFDEFIKQYIEL